jgi:hypothetical protein
MPYTYQATGNETEIFDEGDDHAVPVVLVPFLDTETPDEHQGRVKTIVNAMNAAKTTETLARDPYEGLRRAAMRAISANAICAATNTADMLDPDTVFEAIHSAANDLTISTQTALARELGWLVGEDGMANDIPPTGLLYLDRMTHGGASDQDIEHAFENATGQSVGVAKNV